MPDGRKPHLLWWVVFLLAPVALLNYLDRQMLSAMKFSVMGELRDIGSDTRWGIMLAQFKWVYACLSPVGGYLADRFSRRGIIVGSLAVWSAITWWTGQATSYSELLWARTLMGVSEAFYIPAALALLMDYHTGATKSRATGVHMAAIYLGVILGGFAGYVADAPGLGWRWAFHTAGAVGMVYALPLFFLLKDPPHTGESTRKNSPVGALKQLLSNPSFLLLTLYFALIAWPGWMMKDWMPAMLKSQFELSQGRAGVSAGLYVNLAGFVGLFLGGLWADRWVRKSVRGRTAVSAVGMGLIIPALFGLGYSPSIGVAIGFLALFGLGFGLFDGNNMPILSQLVRPELRATGYGVMNFVSVSLGGFADIGVGRLRDSGASFAGILSLTACAVVVNVLLVLLIRPRPELTPELERV